MKLTIIIAIIIGLLLGGVWTLYFPFNNRLKFGLFDGAVFIVAFAVAFAVGAIITGIWKLRIAGQI